MKKCIENKMQVGFGFGALLERFLVDFRPKLGAKLDQVGTQIRKIMYKSNIENMIKILIFFIDFYQFSEAASEAGAWAGGNGGPYRRVLRRKIHSR